MKPLNYDDPGCGTNLSSNCVIWQGPDIECLQLCKGDSISEVIYKLATEVCSIINTLNISEYDFSCFALGVLAPEDFQSLIQIMIERICKLETCTLDENGNCKPITTGPVPGCPDCEVPVTPAFFYTNPQGDTISHMQLKDYVTSIGNKVTTMIIQIQILQSGVSQLQIKVSALENTPPPIFVLPKVTPSCVLPGVATDMNIVLTALEQQFCTLINATGSAPELFNNIGKQCLGLGSTPALASNTNMSGILGWNNNPSNVAQSLGNIWLTLCDIRAAVKNIQINCCPAGCDGILVNLFAQISGTSLKLYFTGTLPPGFVNCSGSTVFTITDSLGGTINYTVDIANNMNNPTGISIQLIGTPVDPTVNLTIIGDPCFSNINTGSVCKSCLEYTINVNACCPDIDLTPTQVSVTYQFNTCSGTIIYTIELWDETAVLLLQSAVYSSTGVETKNGVFNDLIPGTTYKVRIKTTVSGTDNNCDFISFITDPQDCVPPTDVEATIIP